MLKESNELADVPNDRELDVLLSSGEQISISKLAILLNELGYKAVSLTGWQAGICTNNTNQNAIINNINTSRIHKELDSGKIVVIAGFQGINENLDITTLGRGGSDTTAVAVAAALNAAQCYIYSDVDGVYTTDPNIIINAKKNKKLSYVEMLDIAEAGAKVLHNRCIEIAEKFNVPIITKSTFNDEPGSIINDVIEERIIKSVVKNDNLFWVNLKYKEFSKEFLYKIFECLNRNRILYIQFINNSIDTLNVDILIKLADINKIQKIFKSQFPELKCKATQTSRLSIIGYGIVADTSVIEKILSIIQEFDVTIYSMELSNTKITITFYEKIENNLLEAIHLALFGK